MDMQTLPIGLPLLGGLALFLVVVMAIAWEVASVPGRSGWADAFWSLGVGLAGVIAALTALSGGNRVRPWLVAALIAAWSLRLGLHIAARSGRADDPRYVDLRKQWGGAYPQYLFGLLQVQAAAGWVLMWPILLAARNPTPALAWSDLAGAGVVLAGMVGEATADRQLRAFRADLANQGRVCDSGLWSRCRHPNYFCEFLCWVGFAVLAIGPTGAEPLQWLALIGPGIMYFLLVHVSGIPPLEAHMLRAHGDAFRAVQRRIPAFWPNPRAAPAPLSAAE